MKRSNKKNIILMVCCVLIVGLILCNYMPVLADVGNNNRYDSGSSSSSSGDGGFFSLIIEIFIMFLFRYPIVTIILVVAVIIGYRVLKKKGKTKDIGNKILNIQSAINDFTDGTMVENFANQVVDKNSEIKVGSGLGLTITKQIIEMHGGKIYVESEPKKGCKFIIIL